MRDVARWSLAAFLLLAGVGHLVATDTFLAQVPPFLPAPELIVLASGVVELALAVAVAVTRGRWRRLTGWAVAAWFVAIFPGNVSQYLTGADAFGLDSDAARAVRLLFQPLLVAWALWCTGAWRAWRDPATDRLGDPIDAGHR